MLRKEVLNTIMNDRDYQDISGYEAIIDNYLIATAAQGRNCFPRISTAVQELLF